MFSNQNSHICKRIPKLTGKSTKRKDEETPAAHRNRPEMLDVKTLRLATVHYSEIDGYKIETNR